VTQLRNVPRGVCATRC